MAKQVLGNKAIVGRAMHIRARSSMVVEQPHHVRVHGHVLEQDLYDVDVDQRVSLFWNVGFHVQRLQFMQVNILPFYSWCRSKVQKMGMVPFGVGWNFLQKLSFA